MRNANRADSVPLGQAQRNLKQARQHVHVFVAIQVSRFDSCSANLGDLRFPLRFHFAHGESPRGDLQQQAIRATFEFACIIR